MLLAPSSAFLARRRRRGIVELMSRRRNAARDAEGKRVVCELTERDTSARPLPLLPSFPSFPSRTGHVGREHVNYRHNPSATGDCGDLDGECRERARRPCAMQLTFCLPPAVPLPARGSPAAGAGPGPEPG